MAQHPYLRTDLACEWSRESGAELAGTKSHTALWENGEVETYCIQTPAAAERLGRPVGEYVTVKCGAIWKLDTDTQDKLERVIARVLLRLLKKETERAPDGQLSVLVVGLGNVEITADAIGPLAVQGVVVTRHLRRHEPRLFSRMDCCSVSALAPGVLGQTGMEAFEVISGAIGRCAVDAVIAIDALAAQSCDRLACTIQLSTAGITPGSGMGNHRLALDREHLGVPVIAIGIPTVVDSSTLVYDALQRAGLGEVDEELRRVLENGKSFFVCPKETDEITRRTAQTISHAINRALIGVARV